MRGRSADGEESIFTEEGERAQTDLSLFLSLPISPTSGRVCAAGAQRSFPNNTHCVSIQSSLSLFLFLCLPRAMSSYESILAHDGSFPSSDFNPPPPPPSQPLLPLSFVLLRSTVAKNVFETFLDQLQTTLHVDLPLAQTLTQ